MFFFHECRLRSDPYIFYFYEDFRCVALSLLRCLRSSLGLEEKKTKKKIKRSYVVNR